ncbi:MAG TPA: cupin domain-containing protein [Planctomycetota bacterium]|nr:cupin domain-containing protein [Planctomycetota bacterium]
MSFHDTAAVAAFGDKLAKVSLFESARMFCDVYGLRPGQAQAGHVHAGSDKVYAVLTGRCRVEVGGESRVLAAGQVAVAPAGVSHGLLNDSDAPATLLVIMAPHPKPPA